MIPYAYQGQAAALRDLGLEKTAVRHIPRPDEDVEDEHLPEGVRRDLLLQHLANMKAHQMAPESEYVQEAREGARPTGALLGGLMGGILGAGLPAGGKAMTTPGQALARTAAGAALGGLGGYGLGHWIGGNAGRAEHADESGEHQRVLGLESKPHGIDRELASYVRAGKARAIEEQRAHDRELAHLNQRRINYNVDAGAGSPLASYPYLY